MKTLIRIIVISAFGVTFCWAQDSEVISLGSDQANTLYLR